MYQFQYSIYLEKINPSLGRTIYVDQIRDDQSIYASQTVRVLVCTILCIFVPARSLSLSLSLSP